MVSQEKELLWRLLEEEGLLTKPVFKQFAAKMHTSVLYGLFTAVSSCFSERGKGVWLRSRKISKGFKNEPAVQQCSADSEMQSSELQSKFTLVISLSATFDYKLHQFSPPESHLTQGEKHWWRRFVIFCFEYSYANPFWEGGRTMKEMACQDA